MKPIDTLTVEILADGTLKVESDEVSSANHGNAEMLLRELFRLAGSTPEVEHKHGGKAHSHSSIGQHRHDKQHI